MQRGNFRSEEGRRLVTDFYRRVLAEAPVPLRTRFMDTGQSRTHLIEAGPEDGEVLLLLHGSAANSATWLGDMPSWSRRFRVLAADIPGHPGLSEGRHVALSGGATAAWLQDLVDAIGQERVRLVAVSLGGWSAIEFASLHPERVQALSLLAPAGLAPVRSGFVFKALPLSLLGDWGSDRTQRLVFGQTAVPRPVLEFGRLVSRHYRPLLERPRVFTDAELGRLRMPIQFYAGTKDALIRPEASARRLARLAPHAEVHLLEGQGHAVLGQTEAILAFLLASRR
jgi:pimeloyl-ACP methyl ester carboxylesterase